MAPPPSPLESALAALADRSPAELSRVPTLRAAHAACAAAGVFDGGAASASASAAAHAASAAGDGAVDVAKLHQIFDAAVHHGMPQLVCHYVDEVCGHDDFSSPDGVEAYLQDGEMVAEWAVAALASAAVVLEQAAALRVPSAAADVDRAGAVFEALRDVLCALGASPSAGGERGAGASSLGAGARDPARGFQSRLQSALDDATRRSQHARALAWALREGLCGASVSDRHGGPAAWAGSVAARRASAAAAAAASNLPPAVDAGALFLDDLLAGVGDRPPSYPFKSAAEAAERVFAEGSAAPAALVAKQCLFLYYLLDAGAAFDAAPARFARVARMSPRLVAETRAAALLDDRERVEALDEACALVPRVAHPGLSARFVAALVSRGRPGAALATTRARRRVAGDEETNVSSEEANVSSEDATWEDDSSCAEAELGVSVRLECGLATEAFLAARGATAAARRSRKDAVARALVSRLASHAAKNGALESLLELPFEDNLERAFVAWLETNGGSTPGAPAHLAASYFLARGRAAEAAAATTRIPGGFASLPRDVAAALEAATRALPEATRRLTLDGASAASASAAEKSSATARALSVDPAAPSDFARTPAGVALAEETAPSAGVLRAVEGTNGHVPFFAPPLAAKVSSAEGAEAKSVSGSRALGAKIQSKTVEPAGTVGLARRDIGRSSAATPAEDRRGDAWTTLRFDDDERSRDVDVDADGMDADGMDADGGDGETTETMATRRADAKPDRRARRARRRSDAYSPFGARRRRAPAPIAGVPVPAPAAPPTATLARRPWATPAKFGAASTRTPARFAEAAGGEGGAVGGAVVGGGAVGGADVSLDVRVRTPATKASASASRVVAEDPAAGTILTGATPVTTRRSARGRSAAATEGSLMFASPAANEEPPSTRRVTRSSARLAAKR